MAEAKNLVGQLAGQCWSGGMNCSKMTAPCLRRSYAKCISASAVTLSTSAWHISAYQSGWASFGVTVGEFTVGDAPICAQVTVIGSC